MEMKKSLKSKKETSFTEGSIPKALIRFSLPVLGALILQAAYGAVDLMVVGMLCDPASISAVGTGSTFMSMITFVITSLAMGSTVTIARHIGERKSELAGRTVGTTILLFLGLGVVLTIVLEFCVTPIIQMMQVPGDSVLKTMDYLRICSAGILVIIAYNIIACILRGAGNANLPLIFVAIACVVNIAADFLFVGGLRMDVAGAAWATVLAQFVSVVIALPVLKKQDLGFRFAKTDLRIYKAELHSILQIGIPIALQELTVQVSFLVINAIVNGMGVLPSAGYGVSQKVTSFIMLVPSALMQSVSAYVAQNMGAGKVHRARKGFVSAIVGGSALGILMFLLGFFRADWLSSLFTPNPDVIVQSANYIRGFSLDCILTCTLFSFIGYYNGCSESGPVMIQGIVSALAVRIPLTILFASMPSTSLFYVGLATPITTVLGILFFLYCYFIHDRKKRKSLDEKMQEAAA